ncbi:carboxylesterase/lipase family protein [Arthrobacter sp. SDTb3-6]|uniref:carboxylesterase/lipase family protein n=1 Tax=Arthrobacter sp. SDTb3-6 TaxID=2713571 RepID=UPI00159E5303|nr:carboxylesterase family protein [Arthrobacter sp. SDTb3-6]NVM97619.1 carboxylesterase/lipase family protein [Arthrobacter sp. SDTb3-6]
MAAQHALIDPSTPPVANTTAGLVRGVWRPCPETAHGQGAFSQSAAFLGIPFAKAPVGSLRFAAPVPHAPWDRVRDAVEHGPTPQRPGPPEPTLIPEPSVPGESTLNLDVFTPAPGVAAALPVMVYLHGGGFTAGSPASPWYDGAAFNRDGVVTVNVSYRLGFDGFGLVEGAPDNRAVLDWLLALEWVQHNIASFGGDPGRVTLAGQSAGGGAVLTLLGMPKAQPLFAQACCLSGALGDVPRDKAQALAGRLAELAGVEPTLEGFASVPEERLLELQPKALETGGGKFSMLRRVIDGGLSLGPMVDGGLITAPAPDSLRAGTGADKPLLLGTADDEFAMAVAGMQSKLRFVPSRLLLGQAGLARGRRSDYLSANTDVARLGSTAVLGRYISDAVFRSTALAVAEARTGAGSGETVAPARTWLYRFSWRSPAFGRAVHCLDVPFFFDCLDAERIDALAGRTPPQALADEAHAAAVSFVISGDPGWAAYDAGRRTKVFDTPSSVVEDGYASVRPLLG